MYCYFDLSKMWYIIFVVPLLKYVNFEHASRQLVYEFAVCVELFVLYMFLNVCICLFFYLFKRFLGHWPQCNVFLPCFNGTS